MMASFSAVVLSFSDRATDKAHSILKECADNLAQAVSSLPPTDPAARQNTSSQDDAMDTSGSASKMVCFYSLCFFYLCYVFCPGSRWFVWNQDYWYGCSFVSGPFSRHGIV